MDGVRDPAQAAIKAFYGGYVSEQWTRFDRYARVEEYVLHKALHERLPAAPAAIADIGGGNGRHAFYLARQGYQVSLCDVTAELLADAELRNSSSDFPLASVEWCDARDLKWPDECADGAVMLGPMYCLQDNDGRVTALREAYRVLKPGAPLFVQFLSRIAAFRSLLEVAPAAAGIFDWQSFLRHGVFAEQRLPEFFRIHYFTTPADALLELQTAGFRDAVIRGMDGPASIFGQRALVEAPDHIIEQWGEIAYAMGADPEYRSCSTHLLAVAQK